MTIATIISILGFGIVNLAVALITDYKTERSKSAKRDMAQKSMLAIVFALFLLLMPLIVVEKRSYDPLLINDFLFYLLMCVFGTVTRTICKWLFMFLGESKSENYDEELSVILLVACIGLSVLCFVLGSYKWFWAYLSVAIGRFLWLDSTWYALGKNVLEFIRQLSWTGWYGTFNVLMVVVAIYFEIKFEIEIEFSIIGIVLSSIGYLLWKYCRRRKENI